MGEFDFDGLIKPFLGYGVVGIVCLVEGWIIRWKWRDAERKEQSARDQIETLHDEKEALFERLIREGLMTRDALTATAASQDRQNENQEGFKAMLRAALERPR